jgi:ubiquinone/menaquinone biosynthesis C-methylase UbiE
MSTHSKSSSTSWQQSSKWYNDTVGEQGHYYHQHTVIPNLLKLLDFKENSQPSLLDLACGQGVLSRSIPSFVEYVGIDLASDLIKASRQRNKNPRCQFLIGDVTKKLPIEKQDFTHGVIVLAIQNIEDPLYVFKNAFLHLKKGAKLILILNHPCFRIPRQSSWKIDLENKIQYRRIDRYMSSLKIPIQTHPGQGQHSPQTWSFHHSLSTYSQWLKEAGFTIDLIQEWCSDKSSEGKMAKMENRSREEIPLFMAISAIKT